MTKMTLSLVGKSVLFVGESTWILHGPLNGFCHIGVKVQIKLDFLFYCNTWSLGIWIYYRIGEHYFVRVIHVSSMRNGVWLNLNLKWKIGKKNGSIKLVKVDLIDNVYLSNFSRFRIVIYYHIHMRKCPGYFVLSKFFSVLMN